MSYKENGVADDAFAVTPSDSADLSVNGVDTPAYGVFVGGAGTLKVTMINGMVVTFSGLAAGQFLPINVKRVWSTGTTATLIIALI